MGCDIHNHVEIFQGYKWRCADAYFLNFNDGGYVREDFCEDRCYTLFSILADVRNNYPTYGKIPCISKPRDIPEDVSDVVLKDYEDWDLDAHSASYVTLKELIEFKEKYKNEDYTNVMDNLITQLKIRADSFYSISLFQWEDNYAEALELASNVRLVFWFDN